MISVWGSGAHRTVAIRVDGGQLPLGFDDATGDVRTLWKQSLYTIPVAEKLPAAEKPKWEPLPAPK